MRLKNVKNKNNETKKWKWEGLRIVLTWVLVFEDELDEVDSRRVLLSIYIIKQDIHIHVAYSRPNGWTEWADIFCGHSWVAGVCLRLKRIETFLLKYFFKNFNFFFFFFGQRRILQLVSTKHKNVYKRYCKPNFKLAFMSPCKDGNIRFTTGMHTNVVCSSIN